jgi:hypothetical protein
LYRFRCILYSLVEELYKYSLVLIFTRLQINAEHAQERSQSPSKDATP